MISAPTPDLACRTKGLFLTAIFETLFRNAGLKKPFTLRTAAGAILPKVEAQVIDRGDTRLYYLVNWFRISEFGRLRLADVAPGEWVLSDPVTGDLCLSPGGKRRWTRDELAAGVPVFLPGEERVLLRLSRDEPKGVATARSVQELEERYPGHCTNSAT